MPAGGVAERGGGHVVRAFRHAAGEPWSAVVARVSGSRVEGPGQRPLAEAVAGAVRRGDVVSRADPFAVHAGRVAEDVVVAVVLAAHESRCRAVAEPGWGALAEARAGAVPRGDVVWRTDPT